MAHLIDKDALVAEIELLKEELQDKVETSDFIAGEVFIMNYFLSFLDTLEVKEADEEPVSKDYRERYKRIAQSESFKEAYDGKSISEEEPVSIDFEKELYKAFGQVKDFTLGMRIAKWFYDMGKNSQEPASEDLKKAYERYADERLEIIRPDIYDSSYSRSTKMTFDLFEGYELETAFEEGANWQREQMMKDATKITVHIDAGGYPYIPQLELYDYDKDVPLAKEGDKYKVVLIKED